MKGIIRASLFLLITFTIISLFFITCFAENEESISISPTSYEGTDSSEYVTSNMTTVNSHCYGFPSLGTLNVNGTNLSQSGNDESVLIIGTSSAAEIVFSFAKQMQDGWELISESEKSVNNNSLTSKIETGVLLLQKSSNGIDWDPPCLIINDFFTFDGNDRVLLNLDESECLNGYYYKIQIAYKVGEKTGTSGWWLWEKDSYEYHDCLEEYVFRVANNSMAIDLFELDSNQNEIGPLSDDYSVVTDGFSVRNSNPSLSVELKSKDGQITLPIHDSTKKVLATGDYVISIRNLFGDVKNIDISVENSLQYQFLTSVKYNGGKKYQINQDTKVGSFQYGQSAGALLLLGDFSISGKTILLSSPAKLQFYISDALKNTGNSEWKISNDAIKKVNDIKLSDSSQNGVILIQKSSNNIDWKTIFEKEISLTSIDSTPFYELNDSDYHSGCYYRVIIACKMQKSTGTSGILFWKHSTFDTEECIEVFSFFAQSSEYSQDPSSHSASSFNPTPIYWVISIIALVVIVAVIIFSKGERWKVCLIIAGVAIIIVFYVWLFSSDFDSYEPFNPSLEDIVQAQDNFTTAFGNSSQLQEYTADISISFKTKVFLSNVEVKLDGDVICNNDGCQGQIQLDIPTKKSRDCTYWAESPSSDISKLYLSDSTALDLPFHIANIGKGIVVALPEEILANGIPTSRDLNNLKISLSNDEVYLIYGDMINYFIQVADAMTLKITEMTFTNATLLISLRDGVISEYNCSMKAKTDMGDFDCSFVEKIN